MLLDIAQQCVGMASRVPIQSVASGVLLTKLFLFVVALFYHWLTLS